MHASIAAAGDCVLSRPQLNLQWHNNIFLPATRTALLVFIFTCSSGSILPMPVPICVLQEPHSRPGARDHTVVWGCNQGGVAWANTQPGGQHCCEVARPTPCPGHRGGGMMGQDGCRGVAVCEWVPDCLQPCPLQDICARVPCLPRSEDMGHGATWGPMRASDVFRSLRPAPAQR